MGLTRIPSAVAGLIAGVGLTRWRWTDPAEGCEEHGEPFADDREARQHLRQAPDHEVCIGLDDRWYCYTCEDADAYQQVYYEEWGDHPGADSSDYQPKHRRL